MHTTALVGSTDADAILVPVVGGGRANHSGTADTAGAADCGRGGAAGGRHEGAEQDRLGLASLVPHPLGMPEQ